MTTTPFWYDEPSILFKKENLMLLWPTEKMTYEEKLNAMTRLIMLLSIVGFLLTRTIHILLVGVFTIAAICFMYTTNFGKQKITKENFQGVTNANTKMGAKIVHPETLETFLKSDFKNTTKNNPFSNVLLPEIKYDPERKTAPPSFNVDVQEDITNSVKKMVQKLNPDIKNTNKQIFGDLGERFNLDQSNRSFYSTANTRIPNDQGAFANYLYGDMPSCKDGDPFACVQDNPRYNLY